MLFVDEPSSKLFCILCQRVFKDPVITSCGVRLFSATNAQPSIDGVIINSVQNYVILYHIMTEQEYKHLSKPESEFNQNLSLLLVED